MQHGGLALVTEYAGWPYDVGWLSTVAEGAYPLEALPAPFLTRMRTVIARQDMTVDFDFRDAETDEIVISEFMLWEEQPIAAAASGQMLAGVSALVLFVLAAKNRFRPHRWSAPSQDRPGPRARE